MTTAISRQLPRTLLTAGLALIGTVLSFSATATPAFAQASGYKAVLSTALEAPTKKVVNGAMWKCEGSACSGKDDGSRAITTCVKVVKAFGPVSAFVSPKGELSADELQRCNAAA
jgi:hypothetical protein